MRDILGSLRFDYEDHCESEESIDLDGLAPWPEKAKAYAEQKSYREATLICIACDEITV